MEHNYDDIVLLERYIERSLEREEILLVEQRIQEEPAFRELYIQEKVLVRGIRYGHLKARLEDLKNLEAALPSVAPEKETTGKVIILKTYWKWMAAAASVVVAIGALLMLNRPLSPEMLYAAHFEHYPNIFESGTRGNENVAREAFVAYDREDFKKAAEGFTEMLKQDLTPQDRQAVLLLLGNSNLMLGNTEAARDNFITLSQDYDDLDHQARWYLSLCYLKLGKKDSAKVILEEIAAEQGTYNERARQLLKKLK